VKTITAYRLKIQFDADQVTHGNKMKQVEQAVDLINGVLQRQPFGLGAALFIDEDQTAEDVTMEKLEDGR
jgi:hypothetical protein